MYRIEQFELDNPQARALRLQAGTCLRVSAGRLWLTAEGRSEDIWLRAGEQWQLPTAMRLWISAEPSAVFQILHPATNARQALVPGRRHPISRWADRPEAAPLPT